MFRTPRFVKKTEYVQFILDTPLTFPGNNKTQRKNGKKFSVKYRDNFYDGYNAYFHIDFKFEATATGGNVAADTQSAPINGSFSLIKSITVKYSVEKMFTRPLTFTRLSLSKNCWTFLTIISEEWPKTSFGTLIP